MAAHNTTNGTKVKIHGALRAVRGNPKLLIYKGQAMAAACTPASLHLV